MDKNRMSLSLLSMCYIYALSTYMHYRDICIIDVYALSMCRLICIINMPLSMHYQCAICIINVLYAISMCYMPYQCAICIINVPLSMHYQCAGASPWTPPWIPPMDTPFFTIFFSILDHRGPPLYFFLLLYYCVPLYIFTVFVHFFFNNRG